MMPTTGEVVPAGAVERDALAGLGGLADAPDMGSPGYESARRSGILVRTMQKAILRLAFFGLPLVTAAWAGCSSDGGAVSPAPDAAPEAVAPVDAFVPPIDAPAPPAEAAPPKRDCAADLQADGIQMHLDCTGLYADFTARTVAPENKPYTPGVQFWSDGAVKSRFLYLPPGTQIDISNFDEWSFPNGTKVWKEFKVGGKLIETRMFMKTMGMWHHTTYRWNATETDAVRKDNGEKVVIPGQTAVYEVPNTGQCDYCHAGRTDQLLGVEAVSLGLATAQGLTLAALASGGRLSAAPPATAITIPEDGTTKAAAALGWLHANCGGCHNQNPNAAAGFVGLRFLLSAKQLTDAATPATVLATDTWKTGVGIDSTRQDVDAGVPYKRIAPSDPTHSLASILSGRRAMGAEDPSPAIQMPPLVTRQVDTVGHGLLDAWIAALPP
jgi:hypothetical protein